MPPAPLSLKDLCKRLDVSRTTVWRMIRAGQLQPSTLHRRRRYDPDIVADLLKPKDRERLRL